MIEDVVEARQRPEDEQDVARPDADELRPRSDPRVVAPGRRAQTRRDAGDVRAVAHRRLAVGQVLHEESRRFGGLLERALEREQVVQVDEDFDVLNRLVGVVQVGVVEPVDPRVENGDADALPGDARCVDCIRADGRDALVQHGVPELLVRVHPLHRRERADRRDLGRRGEGGHEVQVVELDHPGADVHDGRAHRIRRGRGFIVVDDHRQPVVRRDGRERRRERGIDGAARRRGVALRVARRGEQCGGE